VTAPTAVTPVEAEPGAVTDRLVAPAVAVPDAVLRQLQGVCAVVDTGDAARADAGRDWWPIAVRWAMHGQVPARPAAICRPTDADQVAAVLAVCHDTHVPVTAAGGRSGVCGASVPVFGGVALDLCGLDGLTDVDDRSLIADVRAGTFGPDLQQALGAQGLTTGHWPQSMALSTVGGWVACRGAGQYSTRYGKIEDMVVGLDVVLADGRRLHTGGAGPRAAVGPDLTQLFVGSEGTLGVVTGVRLRVHPLPEATGRRAYRFGSFESGLQACRQALRLGATPAVLRLYDTVESERSFGVTGASILVVLDEAEPGILRATLDVVDAAARAAGGEIDDDAMVGQWLDHRNDVSALAPLYRAGVVVDTIEVAARWSALPGLYRDCVAALRAVDGTIAASAHQSHAYIDGACLYFTFAGRQPSTGAEPRTARMPAAPEGHPAPPSGTTPQTGGAGQGDDRWAETYYASAWAAVMETVVGAGAAISHHHGIGLNRARFMAEAPGTDLGVLQAVKDALDPTGILNPGKMGLMSPFGEVLSPFSGSLSPTAGTPSPDARTASPTAGTPSPGARTASPTAESPSPTAGAPSPATGTTARIARGSNPPGATRDRADGAGDGVGAGAGA
jgi:alkyldihydroxyacetonephosphate synthase